MELTIAPGIVRLADLRSFGEGRGLGVALLAAAQGTNLRRPARTSEVLEAVHADLRASVAAWRECQRHGERWVAGHDHADGGDRPLCCAFIDA